MTGRPARVRSSGVERLDAGQGGIEAAAADWLVLLPVLAALAVVPLVVYLRVEPLSGDRFDFWNGQHANFDFFSFYKACLLKGLAAVAGAGLVWRLVRRTSGLGRLPLGVRATLGAFVALSVTSAWASPFPAVALEGFPDRYEGIGVILSYVVLALASFAAFDRGTRARAAVACLAVSAVAVSAVGLLQYAGADPFRQPWVQALILPAGVEEAARDLRFPAEARAVYSTLYHYNYVGSYTALVLPLLLAWLVTGAGRSWARSLTGIATGLVGLVWILSGSRAGLFGGALAITAVAVALRRALRARWRVLAFCAVACLAAVAATDVALGGRLRSRVESLVSDVSRVLAAEPDRYPLPPLELASVGTASVRLRTPRGLLDVRHEDGQLAIQDDRQRQLPLVADSRAGRFRVDDARFPDVAFTVGRIGGTPALAVESRSYVLNFLLLESGIRPALKTGKVVPPWGPGTSGFRGRESVGSARGYIWSRSLPLLRDTLVLGHGPDTFAMVFPQQDFTGKFRVYGTTDMIVDKPHNFLLQTALNTGVLSALALVVLFGWYLGTGARIYLREPAERPAWRAGLACFAGVVGYLASSLFNDSVVSVAPVFWAVLGLGIRMNVEHSRRV